ncbi:MAG: hybrid sensor histidine kinase/response regulator, partial [Flavobacterium sp.]|nr:hybrid sensor histidine kinase/response regulator [Flavobacterium sp.]
MLLLATFFIIIGCHNNENATLENFSENATKSVAFKIENPSKVILDPILKSQTNYSIEQLDNTKGLSNSSVNAIFQDSENLIWIGTWDGLNRYDGNSFKIFRPELNNANSLSNQVILKIEEDNLGQIWLLTMHGINKYNKKTNAFERFYFYRKNKPPLSESEFNLALDKSKNVYCAVKDWGIGYFDGKIFKHLNLKNTSSKAVKKMQFQAEKLIILFENNELFSLNISKNTKGEKIILSQTKLANEIENFEVLNKKIAIVNTKKQFCILDS